MNNYNILVCDDDCDIVNAIEIYLSQEGYKVYKCYNGKEALEILNKNQIHLIIMDVMMPEMDGLQATIKIRQNDNVPIIILSAKNEDTDKIIGLNFGADDYISKPFNPLELIARVKSQLRRFTNLGSLTIEKHILRTGSLILDTHKKSVFIDDEPIQLTKKEYEILCFLMKNMGGTFSSEQIYTNIWDNLSFSVDNTVAVHIRRIREKIEIDSSNPKYLKVVWGIGYKIEKYPY